MSDEQANLTQERIDGPTPTGGAYSIAYYLDKNRNLVPKKLAERMDILEFDKDGQCIRVISGYTSKDKH